MPAPDPTPRDRIPLADVVGGPDIVVLCPTARYAAGLRRAHGAAQIARGLRVWAPLHGATPAQWLDHLVSAALLRGEIPATAAPVRVLSRAQERCLWEQAIADDLAESGTLFDAAGLAQSAMEAERLRLLWHLAVPDGWAGEEYQAFLRWRARASAAGERLQAVSGTQALLWRIDCLARGVSGTPQRLGVAGYWQRDAALERVLLAARERGIDIVDIVVPGASDTRLSVFACVDADAENRAAARWAAKQRVDTPGERLCIAATDLRTRRAGLEVALDRALHPQAVGAAWAEAPRAWAFADGNALASQPSVDTALALLRLAVRPRLVALASFGRLLCAPGWSNDVSEADARAQFDVWLRDTLPADTTLDKLVRALVRYPLAKALPGLAGALNVLADFANANARQRRLPGAWGEAFSVLLRALGWPGERRPHAVEQAGQRAFAEQCEALKQLDTVVGRIDAAAALRLLQQACGETVLEAPREAPADIVVCDVDDIPPDTFGGVWIMGLIDSAWPPPPRAQPLLPATALRQAGVPEARGDLLAMAADARFAYWRRLAPTVCCSHPVREGDHALAASPLLAGLPFDHLDVDAPTTTPAATETLDDAQAPAVDAHEAQRLRGGVQLLATQAMCPAWAFYRYRLGAEALPVPVAGLDARARGTLLHGALEAFWRGRRQADLLALSVPAREGALDAAIDTAIAAAVTAFAAKAPEPPPRRLLVLESRRLARLLRYWLAIESTRPEFSVIACEERRRVAVGALTLDVIVDRIDQTVDGGWLLLDYKSSRYATTNTWRDARIGEPQLPLYAAFACADAPVDAVALARVSIEGAGFVGVAAHDGLLPGVKSLDAQRKAYSADEVADWPALRALWAARLRQMADELCAGVAAVAPIDDKALRYCEVTPLLRLSERSLQLAQRPANCAMEQAS